MAPVPANNTIPQCSGAPASISFLIPLTAAATAAGIGAGAGAWRLARAKFFPEGFEELLNRIKDILQSICTKLGQAVSGLAQIITDSEPDCNGKRQEYCEVQLRIEPTSELAESYQKLLADIARCELNWKDAQLLSEEKREKVLANLRRKAQSLEKDSKGLELRVMRASARILEKSCEKTKAAKSATPGIDCIVAMISLGPGASPEWMPVTDVANIV